MQSFFLTLQSLKMTVFFVEITPSITNGTVKMTKTTCRMKNGVSYLCDAVFEIKRNAIGRYYFVFRYKLHEVLFVSPSFSKRSELEKCISELREAAVVAEICEETEKTPPPLFLLEASSEGFHFSLLGFSGNVMISSGKYPNKDQCVKIINILKKLAADAGIADNF